MNTLASRGQSRVIDYALVGVEFGICILDFEVLHMLGSNRFLIKLSFQISRLSHLDSLRHVSCIAQAIGAKMLRQD